MVQVGLLPLLIYSASSNYQRRLRPFENEVVSGEMRVQITFEQYKVRSNRATLLPTLCHTPSFFFAQP